MEQLRDIKSRAPWNKGRLVGQKLPLKLHEVWAIRVRLELAGRTRDLALFNLAIDSKLRGCDLVALKARDVAHGAQVLPRTMVIQRKTGRPEQFEITENTRSSVRDLIVADYAATPYADTAELALAAALMEQNQPEKAAEVLQRVAASAADAGPGSGGDGEHTAA